MANLETKAQAKLNTVVQQENGVLNQARATRGAVSSEVRFQRSLHRCFQLDLEDWTGSFFSPKRLSFGSSF